MKKRYVDLFDLLKNVLRKTWIAVIVGMTITCAFVYMNIRNSGDEASEEPQYYSEALIYLGNNIEGAGYGVRTSRIFLSDEVIEQIKEFYNFGKTNLELRKEIFFDESKQGDVLLVSVISDNANEASALMDGILTFGIARAQEESIPLSINQLPITPRKVKANVSVVEDLSASINKEYLSDKDFGIEDWDAYISKNSKMTLIKNGILIFLLGTISVCFIIGIYFVFSRKVRGSNEIKENLGLKVISTLEKKYDYKDFDDIVKYIYNGYSDRLKLMVVMPDKISSLDKIAVDLENAVNRSELPIEISVPKAYNASMESLWMSANADAILILLEENEITDINLSNYIEKLNAKEKVIGVIFKRK
ncbi:MAG: hypothetical protein GX663_02060 [Clostridiales bacterium]|nr:hypothetical protein [Clostridiales bacterium]